MRMILLLTTLQVACAPTDPLDGRADTGAFAPPVAPEARDRRVPPALDLCRRRWDRWRVACAAVRSASGATCAVEVVSPLDPLDPCRFQCACRPSALTPPLPAGGLTPTPIR